ncbi:MAG: Na+ dependent nucleoside transporter [Flavobacteriales bacterium]|nr:Na+ dependent nucleoside transporter [Flavobacteriales bacterium]
MLLFIDLLSISRGILGMVVLVLIAWLFSVNRKKVNWSLVGKGILIQLVLAILILKVPFIEYFFEILSKAFIKLISFTQHGLEFLLGSFINGKIETALQNFVFMVLPTIIFFSALTSLFYYLGILQRVVYAFAWIMKKIMNLSGAESLAAAGNIFLGQTESPLLIKPYLSKMTRSEIMCLMTGGMATIAGGVLASYINFLGGDDPVQRLLFAKHLLTASVMSAPAAVVAAKILIPETEAFNKDMEIPKEKIGSNVLEAVANGTTEGIKLAVNVAGMLLVFIAIIYFLNYIMQDVIGHYSGLNETISAHTAYKGFSLQFMIGYSCSPIAWLMGVPSEDIVYVGQLLGEKTIFNEFYAYTTLGSLKASGAILNEKSIIMATYMLCGFSNFASIGIQIGGIGSLAPNKKAMLSQLGIRALIGGTIACLMTAVIAGMLF